MWQTWTEVSSVLTIVTLVKKIKISANNEGQGQALLHK